MLAETIVTYDYPGAPWRIIKVQLLHFTALMITEVANVLHR